MKQVWNALKANQDVWFYLENTGGCLWEGLQVNSKAGM